jgi:hypothetical protein
MATWYYKPPNPGLSKDWNSTTSWWSNANGTGSHPSSAPWTTSATAGDNIALATGVTGALNLNVYLGSSTNAFTIIA